LRLNGGNAERGRDLFVGHAVAQCIRCHTVGGRGGMAGPDLSAVAHPERNVDRRYLLESMMLPNAKSQKDLVR
jgi:quinoprotein glucose dehydrogenase